jgi:hypothetical protein
MWCFVEQQNVRKGRYESRRRFWVLNAATVGPYLMSLSRSGGGGVLSLRSKSGGKSSRRGGSSPYRAKPRQSLSTDIETWGT